MMKSGKMTDNDLNILMQEQVGKLETLGYDTSFFYDERFKGIKGVNSESWLGRYSFKYSRRTRNITSGEIKISRHLAKWEHIEKLCDTIMHECIHVLCPDESIKGNDGGHCGKWLKIANDINKTYGYDIKRYSDASIWNEIKNEDAKYRLDYEHDGKIYTKYYFRKNDVVKTALDNLPLYVNDKSVDYTIHILR